MERQRDSRVEQVQSLGDLKLGLRNQQQYKRTSYFKDPNHGPLRWAGFRGSGLSWVLTLSP